MLCINTQPDNMHARKPRHLPARPTRAAAGIQPAHAGAEAHEQGQEMLVAR